jgi:sugar/nucleoside kinase (ribokinase family)
VDDDLSVEKDVRLAASLPGMPDTGIAAGVAQSDPYIGSLSDPCLERREVGERVLPASEGPQYDAFLVGTVYLDMIFSGLGGAPEPGVEVLAKGLGSAPGGIANLAIAMSRLGLKVGLDAAFGDDLFGAYLWRTIAEQEQVDLRFSQRVIGWPSPVTVSLGFGRDRTMLTYAEPPPTAGDPSARAIPQARTYFMDLAQDSPEWVTKMRAAGATVFADVGWDPAESWSRLLLDRLELVDVFLPNAGEAMAYTGTASAEEAAEALAAHVPLVIVKMGRSGAIAVDRSSGQRVWEPALSGVEALDPTGAGDVFDAAFVFATISGWALPERLRFANLCAGLSVRHFSGSLGAPCWHEISEWFATAGLSPAYSFISALLRTPAIADRVRAMPTVPAIKLQEEGTNEAR